MRTCPTNPSLVLGPAGSKPQRAPFLLRALATNLAAVVTRETAVVRSRTGGLGDLAVGALQDDDGGTNQGAVWLLFLNGPWQAAATVRNDGGINAVCGANLTQPVLGSSWDTKVLHIQHPGATLTILYGFTLPANGPTIGAGELLVDLSSQRLFRDIVASSGDSDLHSLFVPLDIALAGLTAATQALILGGAGPELCNAVDLVIGF